MIRPTLPQSLAAVLLATCFLSPNGLLAEEPEAPAANEPQAAADESGEKDWMQKADDWFGEWIVGPAGYVLFHDLGTGDWVDEDKVEHKGWLGKSVPFVVFWLMCGAIFLTARMMLINIRAFWHAIRVTKGDYDDPDDSGEVSHFQALSSALSATVGLGNIGGVALAVGLGGPGAVFWMVLAGFFGMTSKFTECTLGQMYREVDDEGRVLGGPMRYLSVGLSEMRLGSLGALLAFAFAILCIGASFGGGCAYQVSQSQLVVESAVQEAFSLDAELVQRYRWIYGAVLAVLVGVVIIGGIKRIASTAEKIVPLMCLVYVGTALVILLTNFSEVGPAFQKILTMAWDTQSVYGGIIGAAVVGIQRAAFSNEAGVGSAAIAHSAARTNYPVREGIVAILEPFIDTIVICTMTGLVIVVTGFYGPDYADLIEAKKGAQLTSLAFGSAFWWFPYILAVAVFLFAYSTMISWSYYGERCFTSLFGAKASMPYRILFVICVFLGAVIKAKNIFDFSDMMILAMAVPNVLGLYLLSGKVKAALNDYWSKYKSGEIRPHK